MLDGSNNQIGVALLIGGIVHLRIRAEGPGLIGDYEARLTPEEFASAGWRLDSPLVEGKSSRVLPYTSPPRDG